MKKDILNRKKQELESLIELIYFASATLKPKETLYLIVGKIAAVFNVTRCSMISLNVEDPRYAYVVSTFENPLITSMKIELQKYPEIQSAITQKKPVIIKDASKDALMRGVKDAMASMDIRSIMVIPVIFHDEVIGALVLRAQRKRRGFTKEEVKLCSAIAGASGKILYDASLSERIDAERSSLERFSVTDDLTGIYNVRYFHNRLDEEFSRVQRYNMPLSCIIMDIDHFKRINDTYGYRIGDMVLREFAQLVKRHTRKSDIYARYGGEEFIMLLLETYMKGALVEARRINKVVKGHRFKDLREGDRLTVSIGVACTREANVKTPEDLVTFADRALSVAKKKGIDQVASLPSLVEDVT